MGRLWLESAIRMYSTPEIFRKSSAIDWMVVASPVKTVPATRLWAMAIPFDWNSARSVASMSRSTTHAVAAATARRMAPVTSVILWARPKRRRARVPGSDPADGLARDVGTADAPCKGRAAPARAREVAAAAGSHRR